MLLLLIGVPLVALFARRWSYDANDRAEHAQASRRQVPAALLTDAGSAPAMPGSPAMRRALAEWTAFDGTQRTGRIPAPVGARAGSLLWVWVNASGRPARAPLQHRDVERRAVMTAVLASAGLGLFLLGAATLARRMLDRRRLAAWDAAWRATGPRWTIQR